MFWKLFGSEKRVLEALAQSRGYDISPVVLPANSDEPAEPLQQGLCENYGFMLNNARK